MSQPNTTVTLTASLEDALLDLSTIDLDGIEFVNLTDSSAFPEGAASCCGGCACYACCSSSSGL